MPNHEHIPSKGMLTVSETAAVFGVSPDTVRRWTASGDLDCIRTPGGHRRIVRQSVVRLYEAGQQGGA